MYCTRTVHCSHLDHMFCPDGLRVELSLFVQYCTYIRYSSVLYTCTEDCTCTCTRTCTRTVHVHVQYGSFFLCVSCLFVVRFMCVYDSYTYSCTVRVQLRFESVEVVRSTRSTTKSGTQTLGLPRIERSRGDRGQRVKFKIYNHRIRECAERYKWSLG